MTTDSQSPAENGFPGGPPDDWSLEELERHWSEILNSITEEIGPSIPAKRIRYQVEQTSAFRDITARWPKMNGAERVGAWRSLLTAADETTQNLLPACVQCGECCRRGSPVLHVEDMELLRDGRIGWNQLVTLRTGEPVRSPFNGRLFNLPEERIKVREKDGSGQCVFLNGDSDLCSIYSDRPIECRAQACWDPVQAKEAAKLPYLTRKEVFAGVDLLMAMMAEHDLRCAYSGLQAAFGRLEDVGEEAVREVLELLSYEDHFRSFVAKQFNIPADTLELVFGRSFERLVPIFGFRVVVEPDGSKCLVPDRD